MEKAPHDMAVRFWNNPMTVDKVKTPQGKTFRLVNFPYYYAGQLNGVLDRLA